jgi:hypothetical protein
MTIIWKPIIGYENYYEISNFGEIRSIQNKSKKIIKPYITNRGYLRIRLFKNKIRTAFTIHRLVGINFIPNTENKSYINHIDGNKQNNNVSNLEWVTHSENEKHASENNLKNSKSIIQYDLNGNKINEFNSIKNASIMTGIHKCGISKCCNNKMKTSGNFKWKFKN